MSEESSSDLDRRSLLRGGLVAATGVAVGAAAGVAGGAALMHDGGSGSAGAGATASGRNAAGGSAAGGNAAQSGAIGTQRVAVADGRSVGAAKSGTRPAQQAGVETPPGAHAIYRAYTLRDGLAKQRVEGWMRLLTDDIDRLMTGRPVLADVEPELGAEPSSLTITVGFGRGFVARVGAKAPGWLKPLPAYRIDRLETKWGEADLLLQVTCDDPLTLAHADRVLQRECAPFAKVAWVQEGFRYARGSRPDGTTMRNLFGQVDGTSNPKPGTDDFDSVVWREDGSTSLVLRRIAMKLDVWDEVDRSAREDAVGRRLRDGSPITGGKEHDEPDFDVKQGLVTKVADFAHVRRARTGNDAQRIYRRAYNYANPALGGKDPDRAGLLFAAFQADPVAQFHPIQARLAELDMMNEWTYPVGSSVFWIPPAATRGGFIGEQLLG